ncbi:MAG: hypothetical protein KME55_00470 [Nostoc indistinguendum CM1-VF10]|jgi:hypothetical protein|nr:hypothetical protein [Nostoc indistinguendum CM1-VF10]
MTDNPQQLTVNDRKECLYNLGAYQLTDNFAACPMSVLHILRQLVVVNYIFKLA